MVSYSSVPNFTILIIWAFWEVIALILCFLLSATRAFFAFSSFSVSCSCVLVVGECLNLIVPPMFPTSTGVTGCCHLDHQAFFFPVFGRWRSEARWSSASPTREAPTPSPKITSISSTKNEPKTSPLKADLNASLELQCRETMGGGGGGKLEQNLRASFEAGFEADKTIWQEGSLFWFSKRKKKQARKHGPLQFKLPLAAVAGQVNFNLK